MRRARSRMPESPQPLPFTSGMLHVEAAAVVHDGGVQPAVRRPPASPWTLSAPEYLQAFSTASWQMR